MRSKNIHFLAVSIGRLSPIVSFWTTYDLTTKGLIHVTKSPLHRAYIYHNLLTLTSHPLRNWKQNPNLTTPTRKSLRSQHYSHPLRPRRRNFLMLIQLPLGD